jgi:hypothetical protein
VEQQREADSSTSTEILRLCSVPEVQLANSALSRCVMRLLLCLLCCTHAYTLLDRKHAGATQKRPSLHHTRSPAILLAASYACLSLRGGKVDAVPRVVLETPEQIKQRKAAAEAEAAKRADAKLALHTADPPASAQSAVRRPLPAPRGYVREGVPAPAAPLPTRTGAAVLSVQESEPPVLEPRRSLPQWVRRLLKRAAPPAAPTPIEQPGTALFSQSMYTDSGRRATLLCVSLKPGSTAAPLVALHCSSTQLCIFIL